MSADYHRPVRFPGEKFSAFQGGEDPAQILRVARDTARTLVERVRDSEDEALLERVVAYTDEHGLDAVAELWGRSGPHTLAGALWRIWLLRTLIRQNPAEVGLLYTRGSGLLDTIDPLVAGAGAPAGPEEVTDLADRILRGVFRGDFAIALERAAAFCRVTAAGCADLADDADVLDADRAAELTRRALRYTTTAEELTGCARLWRAGSLD